MSREGMLARLRALEEARGRTRYIGALVVPHGLDLEGAKGRAWLSANVRGAVMLTPEPATEDEWVTRFRPRV